MEKSRENQCLLNYFAIQSQSRESKLAYYKELLEEKLPSIQKANKFIKLFKKYQKIKD
jgi:hypothetical protein